MNLDYMNSLAFFPKAIHRFTELAVIHTLLTKLNGEILRKNTLLPLQCSLFTYFDL